MRGARLWLGACLAPFALLAACEPEPAGEPVVRTQLGEAEEVADVTGTDQRDEVAEAEKPARASACRRTEFEGTALTHCTADPARHAIRTDLAPGSGQPYGSLTAFAERADANRVAFAMTGGAFGDDLRAIGYYVEDGERLSELNRADGEGNFYMKPNGVFFGTNGKWRALSTDAFFAQVLDRPEFGVQSGPMLVSEGELHPDFEQDGASRTLRNAVGVDQAGKAHFVIAEEPISFGRIARYYRDELDVPNALLLVSNGPALWDPASGRLDQGRAGPILIVENRP